MRIALPVKSVQVIEVVRVVALVGQGIAGDPIRESTTYWSKSGVFLADDEATRPSTIPQESK